MVQRRRPDLTLSVLLRTVPPRRSPRRTWAPAPGDRTDQGIDWSIVTAATVMTIAPLLVAFALFQRQFVQSFMRAGIR
jgi:ABC-type glycerol-3-phosphate transport system permease component